MATSSSGFCEYCGAALDAGGAFCASCGRAVRAPAPPQQPVAPQVTAPLPVPPGYGTQPPAYPPAQPQAPAYPGAAPDFPAQPGYAAPPGYPPAPVQRSGSGASAGIIIAVIFAGLLLIGAVGGLAWFLLKGRQPQVPRVPVAQGPAAPVAQLPGSAPPVPGGAPPAGAASQAVVPSVVGLSRADAQKTLQATGGFTVVMNEPRYSDRYSGGIIVSQSPSGGATVAAGDTVYLAESLGLVSTPAPSTPSVTRGGGTFILPESNDRYLTATNLMGLSNWEMTLARNEIYARHGRPFDNAYLRSYFQGQGWYSVNSGFSESQLSTIERKNAVFIREYQEGDFGAAATRP